MKAYCKAYNAVAPLVKENMSDDIAKEVSTRYNLHSRKIHLKDVLVLILFIDLAFRTAEYVDIDKLRKRHVEQRCDNEYKVRLRTPDSC